LSVANTPDPTDIHVGLTIRRRRKAMGFSQEQLAEAIGLTFQQVQKYENARNRVSASKLFDIARFLKADPGDFFPGDHPEGGRDDDQVATDALRLEAKAPGLVSRLARCPRPSLAGLIPVADAILRPADIALASHSGTPSDHLVLEVH
jgi:transcriptional regulator with XRE-family HTH domain